jgi:hypothetical protein
MAKGSEDASERKKLTADEQEEAVYQMREWMMHMQRVNPQFIMPHSDAPSDYDKGTVNLNRAPAAQDTRRRD